MSRILSLILIVCGTTVGSQESAEALLELGSKYNRMGQFDKAVTVLERAVKLAPKLDGARLELGISLARLHRYKEASATLQGVAPPDAATQLMVYRRLKAAIASALGDNAAAAKEMAQALQLSPDNRDLMLATAVAQFRAGQLDAALANAELAKNARADSATENLIGDIQEKRGDSLAAVRSYQAAVALSPNDEQYRVALALELLRHETFDAAILVLEPAVKQFPDSIRLRVALGLAYFLVNRDADGTRALVDAMGLDQRHEFSLDSLGQILIDQSDTPDAVVVKQLCDSADANPNFGKQQAICGGLLLRRQSDSGDTTPAPGVLARLQTAVRLSPGDPIARCQLGKAYDLGGQWAAARAQMEQCVRLRPDSTEAHYRLARVYQHLGLKDLAKEQDRQRAEADRKLAAASDRRFATLSKFLYSLEPAK